MSRHASIPHTERHIFGDICVRPGALASETATPEAPTAMHHTTTHHHAGSVTVASSRRRQNRPPDDSCPHRTYSILHASCAAAVRARETSDIYSEYPFQLPLEVPRNFGSSKISKADRKIKHSFPDCRETLQAEYSGMNSKRKAMEGRWKRELCELERVHYQSYVSVP